MPARRRADAPDALSALNRRIVRCERCPRLRRHCAAVAAAPRRAYAGQTYWGRPVPTTGRADARLWIVGLAPAAHGANRTGRMFTGDRSGDFLYAALHRAGFASAPRSVAREDGTTLVDCAVSAVARCAPPGNRPGRTEIARCREYLDAEWALLDRCVVILALGGLAFSEVLAMYRRHDALATGRAPAFAHGARLPATDLAPELLASYHVSQQNTFTGRLTEPMFDAVLARARRLVDRA
jgi:uracil-DNA glycosylase family 4